MGHSTESSFPSGAFPVGLAPDTIISCAEHQRQAVARMKLGLYHIAEGEMFYNQVVPLPMSLLIIQARLQNNYYRQAKAVKADAQLIAENAAKFNGYNSAIARNARCKTLCKTPSLGPESHGDGLNPLQSCLIGCLLCVGVYGLEIMQHVTNGKLHAKGSH